MTQHQSPERLDTERPKGEKSRCRSSSLGRASTSTKLLRLEARRLHWIGPLSSTKKLVSLSWSAPLTVPKLYFASPCQNVWMKYWQWLLHFKAALISLVGCVVVVRPSIFKQLSLSVLLVLDLGFKDKSPLFFFASSSPKCNCLGVLKQSPW